MTTWKDKEKVNAYNRQWKKKHLRCFNLILDKVRDADIIAKLKSLTENKSEYIRGLIRADMQRSQKNNNL